MNNQGHTNDQRDFTLMLHMALFIFGAFIIGGALIYFLIK